MNAFLKFIGALTVVAGIAAAAYYFVTKYLLIEDECDDCDEISCFDEDDAVVEETEEEATEKATEETAEESAEEVKEETEE